MTNFAEHMADQAALTQLCESGECDHPECHDLDPIQVAAFDLGATPETWRASGAARDWLNRQDSLPLSAWRALDEEQSEFDVSAARAAIGEALATLYAVQQRLEINDIDGEEAPYIEDCSNAIAMLEPWK